MAAGLRTFAFLRKGKRFGKVSAILVISILTACMPVGVRAEEALGEQRQSQIQLPEVQEEEVRLEPLDKGNILNLVEEEAFIANDFAARVKSDEQLNSYVFQKASGEKTVYLFGENVKFVRNGQVLDKDITLGIVNQNYGMVGGGVQYDIFNQLESVVFGTTYPLP